jgi:alkylmercury lyase
MTELTADLDDLAVAMASMPVLDDVDQRLAVGLYRALAEGRPVSVAALAERCGLERSRVADTLARWPGVFVDGTGSVVGFWGLALSEMAHGYVVGGRRLYTWCAWDALFITPILDQVAEVASQCPVTGRPVSLTVGPEGVRRAEPAETVVSFLSPRQPWDDDVITSFCHYVLFFASPEAGRQWVSEHPGTFLLGLGDAFELGRRFNRLRLGPALESDQPA